MLVEETILVSGMTLGLIVGLFHPMPTYYLILGYPQMPQCLALFMIL